MKKLMVLLGAAVLAAGQTASAIDREARMIDRISLNYATLDGADSAGVSILGESALETPEDRWAVLFGCGTGNISPLHDDDVRYWNMLLGLKLYVLPVTSVSVFGTYESFQMKSSDNRDAKGVTAQLKQRLTPSDSAVAPFAQGSVTFRERSTFTEEGTEDSFSEYIVAAGGGCDFRMNEELSFVFEAYYQLADTSKDGTEDLDGFTASVSMAYHWF